MAKILSIKVNPLDTNEEEIKTNKGTLIVKFNTLDVSEIYNPKTGITISVYKPIEYIQKYL